MGMVVDIHQIPGERKEKLKESCVLGVRHDALGPSFNAYYIFTTVTFQ